MSTFSKSNEKRRGHSGIKRSDFFSNDDYSRALLEAGGPGPNEDFAAIGLGPHTQLLQAVHGIDSTRRDEAFLAERRLEQIERPHVFVNKWRGSRHGFYRRDPASGTNAGAGVQDTGSVRPIFTRSPALPKSALIDEDGFAELYSACAFAHEFGLPLDTMITVSWPLMGYRSEAEVKKGFRALIKCIGDWLAQRDIPCAYIYTHENSEKLGLHSHIALYVPGDLTPPDGFSRKVRLPDTHPRRQFKG